MKGIRIFFATLKEGIKSLWSHRAMGFASVVSIMLALMILGAMLISALTLNQYVVDLKGKVDQVILYLNPDVEQSKIDDIRDRLDKSQYIKNVRYKSSKDALEEYKKTIGESDSYILEGLEKALPPSFVVSLNKLDQANEFAKEANTLDGIVKVEYYKDTVERVMKISNYVHIGGAIGVGALVIISIFIISNTIKLTVYARKKEIEIKKYIGATNRVITGPFIVEGMVFGLIGALLAYGVIYFGYGFIFERFAESVKRTLAGYLIPLEFLKMDILIIFLTLGVGIGTIGSLLSIRRYLRV
ncbi:permease-like cell division protein FtsX [Lagierella sp.]|uniref:permease-like cell division protein FtsX n=1 Tax=Lagierella sp. TaxID=2849657 RepID=UPI0026229726|nr:permease-like cell division protein FtsX [Lagierella sp.]